MPRYRVKKVPKKRKKIIPLKTKIHKPNFSIYIYKVLKQIHPEIGITNNCMVIISSMIYDILKKICFEAENLLKINNKIILKFKEIQTSVALIFPGELYKHAISEGNKSVKKYNESYSKVEKTEKRVCKTKNSRAGLQFSVSKVRKCMENVRCADKMSDGSVVFLAAVLEYLVAELIELSGNAAKDNRKQRITPRYVMYAVKNDPEISLLFKKCLIPFAGVMPNIHEKLLPVKKKKSNKCKIKYKPIVLPLNSDF